MSRLLHFATAALAALALASSARPARAQDPIRPDTLARDTAAADTLAADTLQQPQDTVPPPRFSELLGGARPGVARSQFHWDRAALLREGFLTLGDLLEHVPAMSVVRAGLFLSPEAPSAFGQTRGRVEVVVDGFVLDPLATSTFDLGTLELAHVSEVRIERRLGLTRIHLSTAEPLEAQPYTRIEAGTGEPSGSLLRGNFAVPNVVFGPLALAVDRLEGNGRDGQEPADLFGVWGKWSWLPSPDRGVQVEYRQSRLNRTGNIPWGGEETRRDLVVRARNRFLPAVTGELFAGRSSFQRPLADTVDPDSAVALERSSWQYGARAALRQGPAWADAVLRLRSTEALPQREVELGGGLELGVLHVGADLTSAGWSEGEGALAWDLRAEAGPFGGLSAFAELAGGERGAPLWADSAGTTTVETHLLEARSALRAGVSLARWGIEATAAVVRVDADSAAPFGIAYDSAFGALPATEAQGIEAFGRIPLWPRGMSFTGHFTYWDDVGGLLYLPSRSWRLALELHTLPLASDNLEILGRFEHQRRESMLERNPDSLDPPDPEAPPPLYTILPIRNLLNAYLQIRVIDVRAFIQWYDVLGEGREDLPGRVSPGPRIFYGVKWDLFN